MKDTTTNRAPAPSTDGYVRKQKVSGEALGHKLPNFGERTRFFLLGAHPSSFELLETTKGWRLVPTLKRLIVQAGVNFTEPVKEGQALDSSAIEAKFRSRFGVQVLVNVDDYLYATDGADGKKGHFLTWENVKTYPDGAFEVHMDLDGYALWRWSLIEDGTIAPPRDSVVAEFTRRLKRQAQRATRTPHLMQAQESKAEAERRQKGLAEAVKALADLSKGGKKEAT